MIHGFFERTLLQMQRPPARPKAPQITADVKEAIAKVLQHFTEQRRQIGLNIALKSTFGRKGMIQRLLRDGYSVNDINRTVTSRFEHWSNDPGNKQYLVPETIFRPSNFPKYHEASQSAVDTSQENQRVEGNISYDN